MTGDLKSLIAETSRVYGKKISDNIFTSTPFLALINEKGKEVAPWGDAIYERVEIAENSNVSARGPKDAIDTNEQDPFRVMQFPFKYINGSLPIFEDDVKKNSGPGQIGNLVKDLFENAQNSITRYIGTSLFGAGTDAKQIDPLNVIVSSSAAYGSIVDEAGTPASATVANNSWWASPADVAVNGSLTLPKMAEAYNSPATGSIRDFPDLIVTTSILYEKYMSLLDANKRYSNDKIANYGFENIMFRGATVVWDPNCTATNMYFLNTNYFKLRPVPECMSNGIIWGESHKLEDKFAEIQLFQWVGNIVCTSRRHQVKITGATA